MAAIGTAVIFFTTCAMAEHGLPPAGEEVAPWAMDPGRPGRDLPSEGRSLFDFAVAGRIDGRSVYEIPPTFDALLRRVEQHLGCKSSCSQRVFIPLGRSLQRTAASPDFFASPRVVVAITGEGAGPSSGKDRIYLGYQPRANVIEVISYNETAGRFEFQLVKNYRRGATPQVVYADRSVCIACHQNHGPIFSRQVWDETNANPKVAALLSRAGGNVHRIPVEIPNAIDDATDRANLIGVTQRIWIEACDAKCRAAALIAALQYRLSGEKGFDRRQVAAAIAAGFRKRWPNGLAIPNPDIPNRDPLVFAAGTSGLALAHVPAQFEPLVPRAPLETWRAEDAGFAHRFITGLAQAFAAADVRAIDDRLAAASSTATSREYRSACTLVAGDANSAFDCRGEVLLSGNASALDAIAIGSTAPLRNPALSAVGRGPGVLEFQSRSGRRARLANGDAIARVALRWRGAQGEAKVTVTGDFANIRDAVAGLSLPDKPFSRRAIMSALGAALGLPAQARCCDASSLPPAQADVVTAAALPSEAAPFQQPCGACHATAEPVPPNFLAGDARRISASLAHCAPRMFVRLSMWDTKPDARDKVPMPPPQASLAGHPWIQDTPADAIRPLRNAVAGWLRAETGEAPDLARMLSRGYENLRSCLPAGA